MNIANSQVQRRLRVLYTGSRSSKCHWVTKRVKKWLVLLNDHVQAVFIEKCEEEIFWQKYWCTILSGIKMYKMEMSASHGPRGAGMYSAYGQSCIPVRIFLSTRTVMSYIRTPYLFSAPLGSNVAPAAPVWVAERVLALWHAVGPRSTWACTALHRHYS